jgi:hypothetical protein
MFYISITHLPLTTAAAVVAALNSAGYYCGRLREGEHSSSINSAIFTTAATAVLSHKVMVERSTVFSV